MAGARQQLTLGDEQHGPITEKQIVLRVGRALLAVLNPVVFLCFLVAVVPVARQRLVKPVWLVLVSVVWLGWAVFVGAMRLYWVPYSQVVQTIRDGYSSPGASTPVTIGEDLLAWVRTDALPAFTGQLWIAVPLALTIASAIALYRSFYSANWRRKKAAPSPKKLTKIMNKLPEWPQRPGEVTKLADLEVLIGVDRQDGSHVALNAGALGHHTFIDGPSGQGKTTDLITLFRGLIEAPAAQRLRLGLMFVNMKPDPDLTAAMHTLALVAGRKLHVITEDGRGATTTYNPLRHGTAEQARNIVIEAEAHSAAGGFSEAHYRHGAERYMLLAMDALTELVENGQRYKDVHGKLVPWKRDLPHLARILQWSKLQEQDGVLSTQMSARLRSYTQEMTEDRDMVKHGSGIRQRIANAVEGAAGSVLSDTDEGLDLREAFLAGDLVFFNLDSARDAQAARNIGNLALQDAAGTLSELGAERWHKGPALPPLPNVNKWGQRLQRAMPAALWRVGSAPVRALAGLRAKRRGTPGDVQIHAEFIVVDEFSALGGTILGDLFTRSRASGGAVVLSTQDSSDMDAESPTFRKSVWKNTGTKLLHRQEIDAEDYATMVGTEKQLAETQQVFDEIDLLGATTRHSGQGSLREVDQFVVHPNELRNLQVGQIILISRDGVRRTNVRIMKPARVPEAGTRAESKPPPPPAAAPPAAASAWAAAAAAATTRTVQQERPTPMTDFTAQVAPADLEAPPEEE